MTPIYLVKELPQAIARQFRSDHGFVPTVGWKTYIGDRPVDNTYLKHIKNGSGPLCPEENRYQITLRAEWFALAPQIKLRLEDVLKL